MEKLISLKTTGVAREGGWKSEGREEPIEHVQPTTLQPLTIAYIFVKKRKRGGKSNEWSARPSPSAIFFS